MLNEVDSSGSPSKNNQDNQELIDNDLFDGVDSPSKVAEQHKELLMDRAFTFDQKAGAKDPPSPKASPQTSNLSGNVKDIPMPI